MFLRGHADGVEEESRWAIFSKCDGMDLRKFCKGRRIGYF